VKQIFGATKNIGHTPGGELSYGPNQNTQPPNNTAVNGWVGPANDPFNTKVNLGWTLEECVEHYGQPDASPGATSDRNKVFFLEDERLHPYFG
jgi:hypothetical protein